MNSIPITLSFDDAPTTALSIYSGEVRTSKLVQGLAKSGISEAVFYCNLRDGFSRLEQYSRAGHIVANHTANHPDCNKVSAKEFIDSIQRCEDYLSPLPTFQKWFRFPYLREAHKDQAKNTEVKNHLNRSGYKYGFITIETFDWSLNQLWVDHALLGKNIDRAGLESLYCEMLLDTIKLGAQEAYRILGRHPIHVLLLHENDLNAEFLPSFIERAKQEGFIFPPASTAFTDPIANPKWQELPKTMRRLHEVAEYNNCDPPRDAPWLDEEFIKTNFQKIISI